MNSRDTKTIYTAGYGAGWSPEMLDTAMRERGAVLVDIRYQPWSKPSQWARPKLLAHMGKTRYTHIKALGNLNYRGGTIILVDPESGIQSLAAILNWPGIDALVLLCGCRDVNACHRKVVAELAAEQLGTRWNIVIEHLQPSQGADLFGGNGDG